MDKVRVGVIGCGYWGPNLIRNFSRHPESVVVAVADVDASRADRVGADYRVPKIRYSGDDLTEDPEIDLVVVATPVWTHFALAERAIRNGKHVLVMKPLTTRAEQAEELCDLAERHGVLLAVDHTFLFTGAVQKMKSLVNAGELGDLYYFDSVRINLGLFQHDVNVLWDLAPHDVSILDYIAGGMPDHVAAVGMSHAGSPTENIAYLTLGYSNSFLAHIHVNWLAPAKIRRTIVGGSRRMLLYDDMEPSEKVRIYDKGVSFDRGGTPESGDEYRPLVSYRSGDMHAPQIEAKEALYSEVDNVVSAILGREDLLVNGESGVRVVRILEAGERSIQNNGEPLKLESSLATLKA